MIVFPIHDIILGMRLSPEVLQFRDIVQINSQILKFFLLPKLDIFWTRRGPSRLKTGKEVYLESVFDNTKKGRRSQGGPTRWHSGCNRHCLNSSGGEFVNPRSSLRSWWGQSLEQIPTCSSSATRWVTRCEHFFAMVGFHYTVFPLYRLPLYSVVDDRFNREFVPRVTGEEPEDGMTTSAHLKKKNKNSKCWKQIFSHIWINRNQLFGFRS